MLAEFGHLEKKWAAAHEEQKNTATQLAAEIDVRRAIEQELRLSKSLHLADKERGEIRVLELKEIFAAEVVQYNLRAKEQHVNYELHVKELTERMHQMGQEYSDSLMQVKTALHNQTILTQQQADKLHLAQEKTHKLQTELQALRHDHSRALHEETRLQDVLVRRQNELLELKLAIERHQDEGVRHEQRLKKAELTIARLRVCLVHNVEHRDAKP